MKTASPYSVLGRFYDRLTPQSPGMNRYARNKILGPLLPSLHTVCDLGCGTGTTAIELARAGHKVCAVDLSPTQCGNARRKSRSAGVSIRVICADMRQLRLPERVDLVLCEFNPLNHLPRKRDLTAVFQTVARVLVPGGWFYFDVNMRPTYTKLYPATNWEEHDEFCLLTRGGVDERREKAWLDLTWFVAERGRWRREHERIEDTWWSDAQIKAALRHAGFGSIRAWDGTRVRPPKIKPRRGYDRYYLARLRTQA